MKMVGYTGVIHLAGKGQTSTIVMYTHYIIQDNFYWLHTHTLYKWPQGVTLQCMYTLRLLHSTCHSVFTHSEKEAKAEDQLTGREEVLLACITLAEKERGN